MARVAEPGLAVVADRLGRWRRRPGGRRRRPRARRPHADHGSPSRGTCSSSGMAMHYNFADLFEAIVDLVPDRTAARRRRLPPHVRRDSRTGSTAWPTTCATPASARATTSGSTRTTASSGSRRMIALYKIRAVPVNINYRYVEAELELPLRRTPTSSRSSLQREFAPRVAAIRDRPPEAAPRRRSPTTAAARAVEGLEFADYEAALAAASPAPRLRPSAPDDDIHMIYTGGTTGHAQGRDVAPGGHLLRAVRRHRRLQQREARPTRRCCVRSVADGERGPAIMLPARAADARRRPGVDDPRR